MSAKLVELPQKSTRSLPPVFSTGLGALYHTDCLDLFANLNDESIDTIFADPPFNIGKDYGRGRDKDELDNPAYLNWCYEWIDEAVRVVKPGGAIFIYNLPQWAYHLAAHLESRRMTFRHWIAVSMKGTFPRGRKLYPAHYALLYFTKGPPRTFNRDEVRLPVPACRPLREGHQRLRRAPQVAQSPGPQPDRHLGRHVAGAPQSV